MSKDFNLWVGTQINPADRLRLNVSSIDLQKVQKLPPGLTFATATVRDLITGKAYTLRRADCGSPGCICAVELVGFGRRSRRQ
jgi:hypothetical protein